MGFRPEPTVYTLKFEKGSWLDGLKVRVGSCTISEFNEMLRWKASTGQEVADNNDKVLQRFLDYLVEWNLENKDGTPTPHTVEGCADQEQPVIREILSQWQSAMAGVSDDLGKDSANGSDSLEESLGLGV